MMKHRIALALFLITNLFTTNAQAADDKAAIETAVFDYLEGFFEANPERINKAFSPEGRMVTITPDTEGKDALQVWEMAPTLKSWAERKAMPIKPTGEILSIDIRNGQMASVVFDSNGRFYDFLTLAKLNGEWKIIHKAFIRQPE